MRTDKPQHGGKRAGAGPKFQELKLSVSESLLIVDTLNGTIIEPQLAEQLIWMSVEDAIRIEHLDKKWQVDGAELVRKLQKLTNAQANELLQKIEQFWAAYHVDDSAQRVKDVGLANN